MISVPTLRPVRKRIAFCVYNCCSSVVVVVSIIMSCGTVNNYNFACVKAISLKRVVHSTHCSSFSLMCFLFHIFHHIQPFHFLKKYSQCFLYNTAQASIHLNSTHLISKVNIFKWSIKLVD